MTVFAINPLHDTRWQNLVISHPRSSVFHTVEWLQSLKSTYGYEPVVYTLSEPGSPLTQGIVFCEIRSALTGKRLVSLPFTDHCEPLVESEREAELLFCQVKEGVKSRAWKYVELRPVSNLPWDRILSPASSNFYLHTVDLLRSEHEIFASFHKDSVQRKIRRAERESLRYHEGTAETELAQFYELMIQTRRRHHIPPQPLNWFRHLVQNFGTALKIRIALKGEIPVASILTLAHKSTMMYKYGCSDDRYQNLGGTALLFWNTILEARGAGFGTFELGRSDINNAGLVVFKERWGAAQTSLSYRRFPEAKATAEERRIARWLIERLVPLTPDRVLVAIGERLYRHIG